MKKEYKDLRLKQGTPEWLAWREQTGFGGSEIASVMATSSVELGELVYTPPLKLFLSKIDEPIQQFTGNINSEAGKYMENVILKYFKHYDLERPDQMQMYDNIKKKNVCNKIIKPNNVFWTKKYEWLFYSPDAVVMKDGNRVALCECKNTTSMEAARYTNKINPAFYLQVQAGLMITGLPIGYALVLVDGCWFEVVPIYPDPDIFKWIEEVSAQFWMRIIQARKIKIEYGIPAYFGVNPETLTDRQKEGAELLSQLEPDLLGSSHEMKWIREMIVPKPEKITREGTSEEWTLVMNYLKACEHEEIVAKEKNESYSKLLLTLDGCNYIQFDDGKDGYYSYLPDKNGRCSLRISKKVKAA